MDHSLSGGGGVLQNPEPPPGYGLDCACANTIAANILPFIATKHPMQELHVLGLKQEVMNINQHWLAIGSESKGKIHT